MQKFTFTTDTSIFAKRIDYKTCGGSQSAQSGLEQLSQSEHDILAATQKSLWKEKYTDNK